LRPLAGEAASATIGIVEMVSVIIDNGVKRRSLQRRGHIP